MNIGAGTNAIGSLRYALDLPRGGLSAPLERRARTTGDDDAIVQTVARLGHIYENNAQSCVNLSLDYARIDSLNDPTDDSALTRITVTYCRALTRDWSMNVGPSHTRRTDGNSDATANAMTVSLCHSFIRLW